MKSSSPRAGLGQQAPGHAPLQLVRGQQPPPPLPPRLLHGLAYASLWGPHGALQPWRACPRHQAAVPRATKAVQGLERVVARQRSVVARVYVGGSVDVTDMCYCALCVSRARFTLAQRAWAMNGSIRALVHVTLCSRSGSAATKTSGYCTLHTHTATQTKLAYPHSPACVTMCVHKQGTGSAVFQSGILNLEMLLKQAAVFAAPLGTPNRLQVAVAFHALDEATKLFQRHSGLLAEVRTTLC